MNPFDLKSALLAKHAQHILLIHFPIALFIASVAFDFAAHWTKKAALAATAYYNLLLAAIFSIPVVATGILAWRWQLEGQRLHGLLLMHLVMGIASSALVWIVFWIHFRSRRSPEQSLSLYRLPVELLAVLTIALTAHLGGFLSGVNTPASLHFQSWCGPSFEAPRSNAGSCAPFRFCSRLPEGPRVVSDLLDADTPRLRHFGRNCGRQSRKR